MKNILITGGAGFVGSHICVSLLEEKYNIYIADNFSNSSREVFDSIRKIMKDKYDLNNLGLYIYEGDIKDESFLKIYFLFFG